MKKAFRFWTGLFLFCSLLTLLSPFFAPFLGDGLRSEAMAFSRGGPLGLGYDYIGRPLAPQLLLGGRELLLASLLTAFLARSLGLGLGIFLANPKRKTRVLSFFLDAVLILPMAVVSLASYQAFHGSVYAIVPILTLLSLPFSARYYARLVGPILESGFFSYASLRERSWLSLVFGEILPILAKNLLTDMSHAFISAIYMLSSVSFLGSLSSEGKFLWPQMLAENLSGFALNPWATLAPLLAILFLTVPLGSSIDALERRRQ